MELTQQEKVLVIQMLQKFTFAEAASKIVAGQLQMKLQQSMQAKEPPASQKEKKK